MDKPFDPTQGKFKVSLYIRVSTGRQANEGDSLEEQEKELKKFCEYKGYVMHKVHIERGKSAKDTKRPEYQKLLEDIQDEKIKAVVVKKLDRLSRSLLDFESFMTIAQNHDVEFISLKENFDTTNAMGKAMLRVALVFAQLEREQLSERVSDVMNFRAEQGLYNGGGTPYGYDVINKELVPHKQEKKAIETMFNKFLETQSTTLVAKELNLLGMKNRSGLLWDARQVDKTLRKVVYIGKQSWSGQTHSGVHQPLVSEESFNKAQEIFAGRKRLIQTSKIGGILKGFIYCGQCEAPLTSNYAKKKKTGKRYFYYRCLGTFPPRIHRADEQCKSSYFNMQQVEQTVFNKILEFSSEINLNQIQKSIDHDNQKIQTRLEALRNELDGLQKQLESIKAKKERYLDSLISKEFKSHERQVINEKIDEFSLEEKQTKATIYRQEFEISNHSATIQSIDGFKQEMVFFRVNYKTLGELEQAKWLRRNIEKIRYTGNEVKIDFKLLKIGSTI